MLGGLVDTLPELPQMSLLFSMNLCPKYVCVYSCSNYLPFEVCEFPIAGHTHPCAAIQWNLLGRVRRQGLAQDHGLVPDHGLVHSISGCLFKGALYRIWCGVNRLGDSGVKVV